MEQLAWRYHQDALALVAGYGYVHPLEGAPPQVNLIALADSLAHHGKRLSRESVPPKDAARWRPSGLHPPGYAWFLSVVYRVFGEPLFLWAKTIQAILDAGACLLVLALGRRFAGAGAGLAAAVSYAVFLPIAYLVTSRVADGLMPGLFVAMFALFVRALETRRLGWYAASGVVLGLACLLRPDVLMFPFFMLVAAVAQPGARARAALGVAVLSCTALAVLLPWGLRNQHVSGRFTLTTSASGMALYQSIGQFPNPYGVVFDDGAVADSARLAGFEGLDDPAASRYFTRRFLDIAGRDPGLIVGNMVRRIPLGIAPLYHWGYDNHAYQGHGFYDYSNREHLSPYRAMVLHPTEVLAAYWDRIIYGVVALALFVGGVMLLVVEQRRWPVVLLLWLPYLYLFLSHLPVMLGARLLVPGVFGQLIMLGYWYERLVRRRPVHLMEI
jgi:hypothetical protein